MARIDELIFGYRVLKIKEGDMPRALSLALKLGICATVTECGFLRMKYTDCRLFMRSGGKHLCESVGEIRGAVGFVLRAAHAWGAIIGITLGLLLYLLSGELVWDVRVSGTEDVSEYEVVSALREAGFGVGSLWRTTDKNLIEAEVLSSSSDIGWISINRRGTVAYVDVRAKKGNTHGSEGSASYTNLVAARSCVIESVSVVSGKAVVKAGDVVEAGDILISGIVESESGVRLCRAEGEVMGRCLESFVTSVSKNESVSVMGEPLLCEVTLNIFNLNINIFKNYGNSDIDCDIIEDEEECVLFGNCRLPFGITRVYSMERLYDVASYTVEQMSEIAGVRMYRQLHTVISGGDLISLRSEGELTEDEYRLTTTAVFSLSVGVDSPIYTSD